MTTRDDIQFISKKHACRGWLYKPDTEATTPCIVMAHGFCGVKEMRLDAYAERFAENGYHVLVFDYRHFGDSDGEPRQLLDIKKQHQDWHAAIDFTRSLPKVAADNIILWGTSFSGGHVISVAEKETGISAVIAQVPHLNGLATAIAAGPSQNFRLSISAFRDYINAALGRAPYYVPAVGRPGDLAAMTAPGEFEASRNLYPYEGRFNETVAARIFLAVSLYSPGKLAGKLSMPLLIQIAEKDVTTPAAPAIKAANKAPKGELISYNRGHFDIYVEPDFEQTITDQLLFLNKHVPGIYSH